MVVSHRLLFGAAVAVPLALLALAGWLNFGQIRGEAERDAAQNVHALSEHAQRTFRTHQLLIEFVDRHVGERSWQELGASEEVHRMLAGLAQGNPDVTSIFMLDPSGQAFMSSRRFPMPPIDASDRDYFRYLRENEALFVSAPARSRVDQTRFFTLAKRRSSPDGKFNGLIAVSVDPGYFEAFYANLRHGPQDSIGLLRSDGTLLVREPALPGDIVLPADSAFMQLLRRQPEAGVVTMRSVADGVERVFAYRRVGDYPVYTSYNTSMAVVWGRWRAAMLPYVLASMLAMLLLLVGVDFAEQRARRAAAEARSREAEDASRAKDVFVAALSHELRNPLAAIAAATEVLQRTGAGAEQGPAAVIARQIVKLRRMLDDLLDTARAVHGKLHLEKRRVDLRVLVEETLVELASSVKHRVETRGGEPWVEADPVRLKQMLDNLVENAVKYGGRNIEVAIDTGADAVRAAVRDDGEGIAPELLPRLFSPFVQGTQNLDRPRGGLGLGLSLVQRLVQLHGGSLTAASQGLGRGSTFTLTLPRAQPPARVVAQSSSSRLARAKILIVDDEADARESLGALLELEGHEVRAAADGAAGLAEIQRLQPRFALVDIGLPGMDGYEVARRARRLHPDLVLVAVTGYGQPQDRDRSRAAGFDAHLVKPFSYEELARTLQEVAVAPAQAADSGRPRAGGGPISKS